MSVKSLFIFSILLVFSSLNSLIGQVDVGNPGLEGMQLDTTFYEPDSSNQIRRNGLFSVFNGKPGKAAFYGLIIPGGGQAYNKRYWKVPIAVAIDAAVIYNLISNTRKFNYWNDGLSAFNDDQISSFEGYVTASQIKTERDVFRKNKEYGILFVIGGHVITILEAFVDRHLIDFDISDDLTFGLHYGQSSQNIAMGVFYKL